MPTDRRVPLASATAATADDPALARLIATITARPEFAAADQTPQDPVKHPEGGVGTHLRLVLDAALQLAAANGLDPERRLVLAACALTHDLGKVERHAATGGANVHDHEAVSARLLADLAPDLPLTPAGADLAVQIVALHDRGIALRHAQPPPTPRAFQRLARRLHDPHLYAIFTLADRLGSRGDLTVSRWLIDELRAAGAAIPPIVLPDGAIV